MPLRCFCILLTSTLLLSAVSQFGRGDRPLASASCSGKCGSYADTCYCNDKCGEYGNCCDDYEAVCPATCPRCSGGGGRYNCDGWAEYDKSLTCENLASKYGCDCKRCEHCSTEPPSANAAKRVRLSSSKYPLARCLDGSMGGYYVRKGAANKYLMFFEGGGWCYDQNCDKPTKEGTMRDCESRSKSRLGTSNGWEEWMDGYLTGMQSADPKKNPVFHDWTLIYAPYCDGMSFSGNATVGGLHFRGKVILDAILEDVLATTSIASAAQVVVSGGSAGASAVYYHVDHIAHTLGVANDRIFGIPDAGFFLDVPDTKGIDCWPSQMRSVFDATAGYTSLHKGCLAKFPDTQWKCLFPEYYTDLIQTRMFVINSLYDSSELAYSLRLSSACQRDPDQCTGEEKSAFDGIRMQHIAAWSPLVNRSGNGIWSPACVAHTMTWGMWTDSTWEVPEGSGNTMASVVGRYLANDGSQGGFVHQDAVGWPDNRPCSKKAKEVKPKGVVV